MKKFTICLSVILLSISYLIVCIQGKEKTIYLNDIHIHSIKCDSKIIECKITKNNEKNRIDIKSKKRGKAYITYKYEEKENKIKVYVHPTGVITTTSYFGKCNGDISFIISFYIIILSIIIGLIIRYKKSIKKQIYSYSNVQLLGLIVFLISQFLFGLLIFIIDYKSGYNESVYSFILLIKENISIVVVLILPIAFLVTILVTISNIILLKNEGKKLKNMLGIFLGSFICLSTLISVLIETITIKYNFIYEYFYYVTFALIAYLECVLLGTCILGVKAARKIPKFDKDAIIILGCKIKEDGTLTNLLRQRVDRAIEFSKMQKEQTGKEIIFIPSGGKGKDEIISEAEAMKNYLIEQGINKKNILIEDKSKNTEQNIRFSNKIISEKIKNPNLAFSTTNYHVFRTGIIATNQKLEIEGIGSKTKTYYWINAYIREFIATLKIERKNHIKTILTIMGIVLMLIIIAYISRVM